MKFVVTIAAATASHISLVQQLAHEVWHRHYPGILSVAQIDYMLERGYARGALLPFVSERDAGLALAHVDDEPAGFTAWYRPETMHDKLDKLYVLPRHQGAGIGRSLIEHVVEQARVAGAVPLRSTSIARTCPRLARMSGADSRSAVTAIFRSATASSWKTSSWCAIYQRRRAVQDVHAGRAKPLRLYDNFTRSLREFVPLVAG